MHWSFKLDKAPLPVETLGRLQKSLDSHRRRAERMGLPAHDIRVAELLAKSRVDSEGYYLCYSTGVRFNQEDGSEMGNELANYAAKQIAKFLMYAFALGGLMTLVVVALSRTIRGE